MIGNFVCVERENSSLTVYAALYWTERDYYDKSLMSCKHVHDIYPWVLRL